jgi:signal peptidase I
VRKLALVVVVVAAFLVGCGGGTPMRGYRVPSPAMLPTLPTGSHVTVALDPKYVPKVGDIVIFHPPTGVEPASPICGNRNQGAGHSQACGMPTAGESSLTFIKRIVAGPVDTLQIVDGHVVRNGQREQEPFIAPCGSGFECNFRTPIKVPSGYYYVLGDSRGASDDSRFWGPVRREWIIGKVVNIDRSGAQPTTT